MQYNNHSLTRKLLFVVCLMAATSVMGQTYDYTFTHSPGQVYNGKNMSTLPEGLQYSTQYKTHADDPRINEGVDFQRTHEYERVVWCMPGGSCDLSPFTCFEHFSVDQYHETYDRWCNYQTGKIETKLSFPKVTSYYNNNSNNITQAVKTSADGHIGGSAVCTNRVHGSKARYTSTDASTSTKDVLDIISWESSVTFTKPSGKTLTEPNLENRVLFVIKNAKVRADAMADNNDAYIDGVRVKLMAPANTPFQYRMDCYEHQGWGNSAQPTDYWYYDGTTYKQVYHYLIETYQIKDDGTETLLGSTINRGKAATEAISDMNDQLAYAYKDMTVNEYVTTRDKLDRMIYIKKPKVGNYRIKIYAIENPSAKPSSASKATKIKVNGHELELMEYELEIMDPKQGNMIREKELMTEDDYKHQRPEELKKLYGTPTSVVNFDDYSSIIGSNGYSTLPINWESSSYGYAFSYSNYYNAGNNRKYNYNVYILSNSAATVQWSGACSKPSSFSTSNPYDINGYYDRKWHDTQGKQKGLFLYCNGASEPGYMAKLDIGKNFCTGTRVYVSAWVMECSNVNETANLVFSFKGVDKDGYETTLSSFVTGYVTGGDNTLAGYSKNAYNTQDNTNNPRNWGKWMHVYYSFYPQVADASKYDHFVLTLDNNCVGSSGADYAVDDIQTFVCKPEIKAFQDQPICNGQSFTSLRFEADFDILTDALGVAEKTGTSTSTETFQYCFLDKGVYEKAMEGVTTTAGYKAAFDKALIKNVYTNSNTTLKPYCGELKFESNFGKMKTEAAYNAETDPKNVAITKKDGTKRTLIFPSTSDLNDEKMKVNNEYIMAIMINPGVSDVAEMFDLTSTCAMTSNIKVFSSGQIKIDGELTSNEDGMTICANQVPVITVDMSGVKMGGEMVTKSQEEFDWYAGPLDAPSTAAGESYETYYTIEKHSGVTLYDALYHFRAEYPKTSQTGFATAVPKGDYTSNMQACIKHFLDEGVLALYQTEDAISTYISYKYDEAADTLDHKKKIYTTIIPINPEPDNDNLKFCLNPFEIVMKISPRTPSMKDGDDHGLIPYPKTMHDVPLRIGLRQLQKCVVDNLNVTPPTGTKFLYLPLRDVTPATSGVKSLIQKSDDDYVYLAASNDPNTKTETDRTNKSGAKLITAGPNDDVKYIGKVTDIKADATQQGNVCNIVFLKDFKFREGYWYTIKFHFEENYTGVTGDHSDVCPGDVVCTIKVVPEYQMWTGLIDGNWNNDKNWRRVSKDDLLNTLAATDEFVTDGTTIENDRDSCFVPADFTKVVIPAGTPHMPVLYDLRQDENLIETEFAGAPNSDYIRYLTPEEVPTGSSTVILDHDPSTIGDATEKIQFDMSSVDVTGGNVACRTWYDHTCDQIHFNAGAEMVGQQYLHYNKAWADVEIHPNRWYTLSTPLVNVVSGDFYLPTDGARQNTPLFEPITYNTSLNDRFKPAVFQRTWNAESANVWHADGTKTDAANGIELQWSHVYNETNLDYSAGNGFSIMADTSALAPTKRPEMVKFRFPKADTKYTYYNPGNETGAMNNVAIPEEMVTADGDRTYKLADLTANFTQAAGTISKSGESYFLVGNPLMCALDMKKFFAANPKLEEKYWLVTEEGQRAAVLDTSDEGYVGTIEDHPYIKPFQAFFVVLKNDATADTIHTTFTTDMMHISSPNDKKNPDQKAINPVAEPSFAKGSRAEAATTTPGILQLSAFDKEGHETKMILTNGTTRRTSGARALFDSNLAGEPMIYSIINGKAMTIGECSNDTIAIGLTGNKADVELHINGADSFGKEMMLLDALTGETQPLTTGITLTQTGNGVRYYLIGVNDDIENTTSFAAPTMVINGNQLTITAPADNDLLNVTVHSISGVCCNSEANAGQQFSTWLEGGIYIVRLQCNGASYSYKFYIAK